MVLLLATVRLVSLRWDAPAAPSPPATNTPTQAVLSAQAAQLQWHHILAPQQETAQSAFLRWGVQPVVALLPAINTLTQVMLSALGVLQRWRHGKALQRATAQLVSLHLAAPPA
jgi:hypothetical protein